MIDKKSEAVERLALQRRELETRVEDLRRAVARETGWTPGKTWIVPVVGFACGLALAMAVKARRGRR